jgi:hypothetical protein
MGRVFHEERIAKRGDSASENAAARGYANHVLGRLSSIDRQPEKLE